MGLTYFDTVRFDRHASVHFELSETEKVGQYEVKVFIANIKMETILLELDDLLEKQVRFIFPRIICRFSLLLFFLSR